MKIMQCRCCGSTNLTPYLQLGEMPLANNLCDTQQDALDAERFDLTIMFCNDCSFSQLSEVVEPEKLYRYYTYRSGMSKGYVTHCKKMAVEFKERYNLTNESFVIDIAGNDGTLLTEFKQHIGCEVLNVDPSINLSKYAVANGINCYTEFWNSENARLINAAFGKADLITATNVFAHVNDLKDFLEGVELMLKDKGILVLEFPYLVDFIQNNEFDTTYFEHLSYIALQPIHLLINKHGLYVHKVEKINIHGGTIRLIIAKKSNSLLGDGSLVQALWYENKADFHKLYPYLNFAQKSNEILKELNYTIAMLLLDGKTISAFAASAKGNTLLNAANLTYKQLEYIIDETPEKIGKYSPGTGIPIVNIPNTWTDYILITAWNFKYEIIAKCRENGFAGKFIIPIPKVEII